MSAAKRLVCFALLAATGAAAQSLGTGSRCPNLPVAVAVAVEGASVDESLLACDAARAVLAFFAPLRLRLAPTLTIEVVAALPADASREAMGAYVVSSHRILVLRMRPFASHHDWFGLAADKRLYRAVIAHEVAHAIATGHAGEGKLSSAAQEYVAYVAMIATMPQDQRRHLLSLHPGKGFEDLAQINEIVYAFHPARFGAESYRHWKHRPNPAAFLRRVLDGGVIEGAVP